MTISVRAFATDYRPIPTAESGNDISLTLSGPTVVAWKGMPMYAATASDYDYYSTDNWVHNTQVADSLLYTWDFGGMGTAGNPTSHVTGVQNPVPGLYTVKSIVNDVAPTVNPPDTGTRNDIGSKTAEMEVAVVRVDIDTGLEDTGFSNDEENTAPGAVLRQYSDNNDLLAVPIGYMPHYKLLNGCKVRLQGSGPIRIWSNADKTGFISIMGMFPPNTGPTTWTLDTDGNCTMPTTVYVEGLGTGQATLELVFYRMFGSSEYELCRDTVKFTIVNVHVNKVEFTSDHNVMTDWNTTYAGDGGNLYSPRGWLRGGANNPVSHSQGTTITANVTLCVQPANTTFSLRGTGQAGLSFTTVSNITSTGSDQVVAVTAAAALPAKVDVVDSNIKWYVTQSGTPTKTVTHSTGPHKIYVTWGTPLVTPTLKRMNWSCQQMTNATSKTNAAEKIRDAVAASPGPGTNYAYFAWGILDNDTPSDCITLASLCAEALRTAGIPAAIRYSYGTHDGSGGFPDVNPNTCQSLTSHRSWDSVNHVFWDTVAAFPENRFEGFFTTIDGVTKAFTVYPKGGPFVNQDYYYLEAMRAASTEQRWMISGDQEQNGVTKIDGTDADEPYWSTPQIP